MTTLDRILNVKGQLQMKDNAFERRIGVPGRTVDAWKRGLSHSYLKHLPAIAQVLGVSTDFLLGVEADSLPVEVQLLARRAGQIPEQDRARVVRLLNATMDAFMESVTEESGTSS